MLASLFPDRKKETIKELAAPDISRFIDEQPFSRFQLLVVMMCGSIVFMDGYDVQAMGYVAPVLTADLNIARTMLGPLISIGLVGMMIGALTFGPLADRFGRRPVLITCALLFGAFSLLSATATTAQSLGLFRLLTGFGLGGAMPNTIALTAEYTPRKYRSTAITAMFGGFTIGAAAGGFVAAFLIPRFGWQSVFVVGGIVPLCIAGFALFLLPESIRFLLMREGRRKQVFNYLSRIAPGREVPAEISAGSEDQATGRFVVGRLFTDGRAMITLLLWIMFFMNLLDLFFLNNWLPTVMNDAGIPVRSAILITTLFQIGGTAGAIIFGRICDRGFPSFIVLSLAYLGAAISVFLIGESGASIALLITTVSVAGFCVVGGQTASNAVAASYYPTSIRSTGVGWSLGVGRIGSIIGPILGGELLSVGGGARRVFWAASIPVLIAAAAALVASSRKRNST